jgi:hypothetical protein
MITISGKPAVFTELLPNEIIGYQNLAQFTQHMKISCKRVDGDWPGKELAKLGPGGRSMVAETLARLWEHGFVVRGIGKNGNVLFGCRLRSASDDLFEGAELERLKRLPLNELQALGRGGYRQVINKVQVLDMQQFEADIATR